MNDVSTSNYQKYFGTPERAALTLEMINSIHHDRMDKDTRMYEASICQCICDATGFPENVPMSGHRTLEWLYDVPAVYLNEKWVRDCCECDCCARGRAIEEIEKMGRPATHD